MSQQGMFEPKTKNGYDLALVRSTLQKCIRFGDEVNAGYWAAELYDSGFANYLFTILNCICNEDIGHADPALVGAVMSNLVFQKELWKEKKGKCEVRPALGMIILMLCRARKTRAGDNFWQYIENKRTLGWRQEIPDFALDEHTAEGRKMGRWWRFWIRIGSALQNKATYEEIGGIDYEREMNGYWGMGHPSHQDEPDWKPIDMANPYGKIEAVPFNPANIEKDYGPNNIKKRAAMIKGEMTPESYPG